MSLARALVLVESTGWEQRGRSPLLSVPSLPCRPAVLLIAGLAWTVLETATASGTFQGEGGALGLGQSQRQGAGMGQGRQDWGGTRWRWDDVLGWVLRAG